MVSNVLRLLKIHSLTIIYGFCKLFPLLTSIYIRKEGFRKTNYICTANNCWQCF